MLIATKYTFLQEVPKKIFPKLMQKRREVEWISVITQTKTFYDLLQMVSGRGKKQKRRKMQIKTVEEF